MTKCDSEIVKKAVIRYLKRYVVENMRVMRKAIEKSAERNNREVKPFFVEVGIYTNNDNELAPVFHVSDKVEHTFDDLKDEGFYPIGTIDSRQFHFWEEDDTIPVCSKKYDSVLEEGFKAFAKDCL